MELCIRPSKPLAPWIKELRLMGYRTVGLEGDLQILRDFEREAGGDISCFARADLGAQEAFPAIDCCTLEEALKRRRPPSLLTLRLEDHSDAVDSFLSGHPNRVDAMEVSASDLRFAYESDAQAAFDRMSRLARVTGRRGIPLLVSSFASVPEQLLSPLAKEALSRMTKPGGRSLFAKERRFAERLMMSVTTRRGDVYR